MICSRHW